MPVARWVPINGKLFDHLAVAQFPRVIHYSLSEY